MFSVQSCEFPCFCTVVKVLKLNLDWKTTCGKDKGYDQVALISNEACTTS